MRRLLAGAPEPAAKSVIVLWMAGGPSHIDTFDPKPGAKTGGPFGAIDTRAQGLRICEHLPGLAGEAHRFSLIRSMTSNEGSHGRGSYYLHTGHPPTPTARHPSLGAIVSREKGREEFALPSFVSIGGPSVSGGYLGQAHSPFVLRGRGDRPVENLAPPEGLDSSRMEGRLRLLAELDETFASAGARVEAEAHAALFARAQRMMGSPLVKAFDTSAEPAAVRQAYGDGEFGQRCLMARRLVEAGVPAVEVTLDGWDTHEDNFGRSKALMAQLDPAFSSLLRELAERDLLERTLVVCLGEFGRKPDINGREGRDHHPRAFSVALAGGGVRGGRVVGATDAEGREVVDRPVRVTDLFATFCRLLGIDPEQVFWVGERPITLVDHGKPVEELIA